MLRTLRILTVAITVITASEVAAAERIALAGVGSVSCGKMIAHVSDHDLKSVYVGWMQGFMSSINWFRVMDANVNLSDNEGQWLWLKNYCNEKPLERVVVAVLLLYEKLATAQGMPLPPLPPD